MPTYKLRMVSNDCCNIWGLLICRYSKGLQKCTAAIWSSSNERVNVTCNSTGASAALQMATSLLQLTLSHSTNTHTVTSTASMNVRPPGGELVRGKRRK